MVSIRLLSKTTEKKYTKENNKYYNMFFNFPQHSNKYLGGNVLLP